MEGLCHRFVSTLEGFLLESLSPPGIYHLLPFVVQVTVGASDTDPWTCTRAYRSQFARSGVNVKKTLGSFLVTADAVPPPGTPLDIRYAEGQ